MAEMEWPSFRSFEEWLARRKEFMRPLAVVPSLGLFEPRGLFPLRCFAWMHGLSEVEAAIRILRKHQDFGHWIGILDPSVLDDVEKYAKLVLRRYQEMFVQELLLTRKLSNCGPLVEPVVTDGQSGFIHEQRAAGARIQRSLLHLHYAELVQNTASVGSRRCVHHRGDCDSTASLENHHSHSAVWQLLDDNGREKSSYMDRSPHLTQTGRGFSCNISPRAHGVMLAHAPVTGYGEAGKWNMGAVFLDIGGSSRLLNWSAEAHPTAGARSGGNTRAHTFIDIPALPLLPQSANSVGEELRETDSENAWASRILETTIGTLLPAAAVNSRDFFRAAPDIVQLAGNMMLPALLGLCFIGMVHKQRAGRILRLATCAAIAATTLGVSSQLPDGIYIFIAAVAGVTLSFITLTA